MTTDGRALDIKTPERFNDCPQTNAALRLGHTCKPDHYYTTADHSDKLERQINSLRTQLADAIRSNCTLAAALEGSK